MEKKSVEKKPGQRSKAKDAIQVISVNIGAQELQDKDKMDYQKAKENVWQLELMFDRLRHVKKRILVLPAIILIRGLLRRRRNKRYKRKRP